MKKTLIIKNVFCLITIVWSVIMLIEYSLILLHVQLEGILFEIFDFLTLFLFLGIFAVPVLLLASMVLIFYVHKKCKSDNEFKILNKITIIIPIILAVLMFFTDFNSLLQ